MSPSPRAAAAKPPEAVAALLGEHRYQALLLNALEKQVGQLNQELEPDVEVLYGVMHYMTNFPDRYHHPKEDLIFERLAQRDPSQRVMVDKLQAAHAGISRDGEALFALIEHQHGDAARASSQPEGWREIRERASGYITTLRRHMDIESLQLFPKAIAGLQAADWREIDADMRPIVDPIFGGEVAEEYQNLHAHYVKDEAQVSIGRKAAHLTEFVALIEALTAILGGIHRIRKVVGEHNRSTTAENRKLLAAWSRSADRVERRALLQQMARMNKERAGTVKQRVEQLWVDARTLAADPYDPRHGEHGPRLLRGTRLLKLKEQEQP